MVVAKEWTLHSMLFSLGPSIRVDRVAGVMLGLVLGSYADESEGKGEGRGKGKGKGRHEDGESECSSEENFGVRVVENSEMNGWRG
jgi:hypothetical protein